MKILVIGDIHGRTIWKDIIKIENPDKVIFLGDYVSSHEGISAEEQLLNLSEILEYKEQNTDKVILLRGNHDCCELGYYWAECYPNEPLVRKVMSEESFKERFLQLTQWVYIIPDTNIVCSHAGISQKFLEHCTEYFNDSMYNDHSSNLEVINLINTIEPCELFGFTPCKMSDYTGTSQTQPCTWIRPLTLHEYGIKDIVHVVGHTPTKKICNINEIMEEDGCNIWMCDALEDKQYLIIDNYNFYPKTL